MNDQVTPLVMWHCCWKDGSCTLVLTSRQWKAV